MRVDRKSEKKVIWTHDISFNNDLGLMELRTKNGTFTVKT